MESKNRVPAVPETGWHLLVPGQKLTMNTLTCRTYPVQGASQETVNLKRKKLKPRLDINFITMNLTKTYKKNQVISMSLV